MIQLVGTPRAQRGQAMVMVLITAAIGSVIAMTIAQVMTNANLGQNNVLYRSEFDAMQGEIRGLLGSPAACAANFSTLTNAGASIQQITDDGGNIKFRVGGVYGDRAVRLTSITLGEWLPGAQPNHGSLVLGLHSVTNKESMGSQSLVRNINISAEIGPGGTIRGCVASVNLDDGIWQRQPGNLNNIFYTGINSPGFVGIGSATPVARLDVVGQVNATQFRSTMGTPTGDAAQVGYAFGGDGDTGLFSPIGNGQVNNGIVSLFSNAVEVMRVANGQVSIGTIAPVATEQLAVQTGPNLGVRIGPWQNNGSAALFVNPATPAQLPLIARGMVGQTASVAEFQNSAEVALLAVAPSGNVGVGTARPRQQLEINKDSASAYLRVASPGGNQSALQLYRRDTQTGWSFARNGSNIGADYLSIGFDQIENGNTRQVLNLTNDGSVGINMTSWWWVPFAVGSDEGAVFQVNKSGDIIVNGGNDRVWAFFKTNGVGNQTIWAVDNNNTVIFYSDVYANVLGASDARLKRDVRPIENGVAALDRIKPVRFNWIDPQRHGAGTQLGVLAQDVREVFPEAVREGADGYLAVNYSALIAPLIAANQELTRTIRQQDARIDELERVAAQLVTHLRK